MSEIELRIRFFGDPILRSKAVSIRQITDEHRFLLSRMARLMYTSSGVGLAATQIGRNEAMFVADIGGGLYKLINPKIIRRQGAATVQEGCLSFPGVFVKVRRAKKVFLQAKDENGKSVTIEADDLLARVFQHEVDHLNGRLIVDHISILDKFKISGRLKRIGKIPVNE